MTLTIIQSSSFKKAIKKLHSNQKADLDDAIRDIIADTHIGVQKTGDLCTIRVYKFKMVKQLTLLAYQIDDGQLVLTLLMLGSNENFHRDVKVTL